MVSKLARLFFTLRHLRPKQLVFFVLRRKFPARAVADTCSPELSETFSCKSPIDINGSGDGRFDFHFLNCQKTFQSAIDWQSIDESRLWRYNLHYFDYLRDESRESQDKLFLIKDWIGNNPQGSEPGWEPFTVSLRIVNWIFFLGRKPDLVTEDILKSLYTQVLWLERNDERHILANHYFENLKALAFAGAFFRGEDADRWRKRAKSEIPQQLIEQNLQDGGHYERSPQYHGLMLENYLDLYNLSNHTEVFDITFRDACYRQSMEGLQFLKGIIFPDGSIPLLNDSAFGVSPTYTELSDYFVRLSGKPSMNRVANPLINFLDSGLYGLRSTKDMLIIDAGEIGPSYQPGHTHCDMLSYELMLRGKRVIVDTGVYEYEPGPMRHYVRSTQAHNTVTIADDEQSEIWGEFRVARRAKVLSAMAAMESDKRFLFEGSILGFYGIPGRVRHHRSISVDLDDSGCFESVHVMDRVEVKSGEAIESRIHFHPNFGIEETETGVFAISDGSGTSFTLILPEGLKTRLEGSYYCPEFGKKLANQCMVIGFESASERFLRYELRID